MRILVVGSGGVGAAFAPIASRRDFYERVVFADIDEARARSVVDRFGSHGRFVAAKVDATDPADVAAVAAAHGCDVILNAADPRFVPGIFQGAFDAGATYIDMAMSLSEPHPEAPYELVGKKLGDDQFAVAKAWEERGQLALVGCGVEPGFSDVAAR
jgi:saccharopine dehydrogenase-like NADP-dependent oxidoreductase